MARGRKAGCGSVMFIIAIMMLVSGGKNADAAAGVLALLLIVGVISILFKPRKCGICGQRMGRKTGVAKINGKRVKACANCVRNIQARVSRAAVSRITK